MDQDKNQDRNQDQGRNKGQGHADDSTTDGEVGGEAAMDQDPDLELSGIEAEDPSPSMRPPLYSCSRTR